MEQRPAAVAGLFYPANPSLLQSMMNEWISATETVPARAPVALIAPHAGYIYSGSVAASAYRQVVNAQHIRRVLLLGPAHRLGFHGHAVSSAHHFMTPLGPVPVDVVAIQHLISRGFAQIIDPAHAQEHALEVQLPFLQRCVPQPFAVVPILVGASAPQLVASMLEALWQSESDLVIVSSDLSHYLDYATAQRHDQESIARILSGQELAHDQACGATPINGLLEMARRRNWRPRLLDLRNSGDTAGDRSRVVGYGALAFEAAYA